jgi:hypothetical protein
MEKMQHKAKVMIKRLDDQLKTEEELKITSVSREGDKAEYLTIEDSVLKSIVPVHNWWPTVTKIEKVMNLRVEKIYFQAKLKVTNDYEDLKFHGTSNEGVSGITKEGFKLPNTPGM